MQIDNVRPGANGANGVNRTQSVAETTGATPVGKPESGKSAGATLANDSATLGAGAALASQLTNASDVRMEKVAAVQLSLAAGTYHVDAGKVADKIIASMLENQR